MTQLKFGPEQIRSMVRDHQLGLPVSTILNKHRNPGAAQSAGEEASPLSKLLGENRELKQLIEELLLEVQAQGRNRSRESGHGEDCARSVTPAPAAGGIALPERDFTAAFSLACPAQSPAHAASDEPVSALLNRSHIIPAIRGPEYLDLAIHSPSAIVWLLYGTPLTLPEIVRQVRLAGKLPIANLDLLTGFAPDADGIALLAAEGVAGVVSTRQSVLRAARAQGIVAVQTDIHC